MTLQRHSMLTRWRRNDDVIWEQLGSEALLIVPATGARWALNGAAVCVWRLCDGATSLSAIARKFANASGRNLQRSYLEIETFCATFAKLGLLTPCQNNCVTSGALNVMTFRNGLDAPLRYRQIGAGASGQRRRPSPRGNSGPG